jgi:hypothetical protein
VGAEYLRKIFDHMEMIKKVLVDKIRAVALEWQSAVEGLKNEKLKMAKEWQQEVVDTKGQLKLEGEARVSLEAELKTQINEGAVCVLMWGASA